MGDTPLYRATIFYIRWIKGSALALFAVVGSGIVAAYAHVFGFGTGVAIEPSQILGEKVFADVPYSQASYYAEGSYYIPGGGG